MTKSTKIAVIESKQVTSMVEESIENKKAIRHYLDTGDKTDIQKRNIRFVKPL